VKTLLTAAWVAPITAGPIRDGGVVFDARGVIAVGDAKDLRAAHPDADQRDLESAVVLPGLINAHAHLELTDCAAAEAPSSFTDWIISLQPRIRGDGTRSEESIFGESARHGAEQCLRFGVTTVGDISQQCHITRPVLRDGPLRVTSYGEAIGIGANRPRVPERFERAIDRRWASERLTIALSPHAPYSVELPDFQQCVAAARAMNLPLATHLAELPYEKEFLLHRAGRFRELLETLKLWRDDIQTVPAPPIRFAQAIGLLDYPTLLAHVNYCDDDELTILANGRASVVYCPRTHRYFGHPPHRWRDMLAHGINVAIGTDSCASSPDLNLVDDLRLVHEIAPDFRVEQLWRMGTVNGATAMGAAGGHIEPGQPADFVVFDARSDHPLTEILETRAFPRETWIAGERVTTRTPAGDSRAV
jgi:cytosine/adenosine deaminase-related metal-dependent hydrolase